MKHNYRMFLGVVLGGISLAFAPVSHAGETAAPKPANYARPFEPPTRPAFIPLPPGTIKPAGWLRDGFTGHMHMIEKQFPLP